MHKPCVQIDKNLDAVNLANDRQLLPTTSTLTIV